MIYLVYSSMLKALIFVLTLALKVGAETSDATQLVTDHRHSTVDELIEGQGLILDTSFPKFDIGLGDYLNSANTIFDSLSILGAGVLKRDVTSNLIVSYKNFSFQQPLAGLLNRNNFIGVLIDRILGFLGGIVSNMMGRIRTVYLQNIGMEIFQLPENDVLGLSDFWKLLSSFPDYVDGVYEDSELNSFIDEIDEGKAIASDGAVFGGRESHNNGAPRVRRLQELQTPNDPYYTSQWAHIDEGPNSWGIETPAAWRKFNGRGISQEKKTIVALIDSGVDYNHPDLKDNIWRNAKEICGNGIDDDQNGLIDDCLGWDFFNGDNDPMDDNGHGTASAGIIAGSVNNRKGIAGICWGACQIMALKTLNQDIKGTVIGFVRAIDYAIGQGAKISNNSYGGRGSGFKGLEAAVKRARDAGMIFVAAAGNYKGNNDNDSQPVYPASYKLDNILSVAAIKRDGRLAEFSSYGRNSVDIAAPGKDVFTTSPGGGYKLVKGTSFAVPFVTGAVALLWSNEPNLPYNIVTKRITDNAKKNSQLDNMLKSRGVLDVASAMQSGSGSPVSNGAGTSIAGVGTQNCTVSGCGANSRCVRVSIDSYECVCERGFKKNGSVCEDVNECEFKPCGEVAECKNSPGSFQCICKNGFQQVGNACEDIDECKTSKNICPTQSRCVNFVGSYDCLCPLGSAWNAQSPGKCLSIRSPTTGPCVNNGNCGMNSLCHSSGSWWFPEKTCECLNGYELHKDSNQCVRKGVYQKQLPFYISLVSRHFSA